MGAGHQEGNYHAYSGAGPTTNRAQSLGETPVRGNIGGSLSEQEEVINQLHAVVNELENRLLTVMDSPIPLPAGTEQTKPIDPKLVLHRIQLGTGGVRAAINRIAEITGRLQL